MNICGYVAGVWRARAFEKKLKWWVIFWLKTCMVMSISQRGGLRLIRWVVWSWWWDSGRGKWVDFVDFSKMTASKCTRLGIKLPHQTYKSFYSYYLSNLIITWSQYIKEFTTQEFFCTEILSFCFTAPYHPRFSFLFFVPKYSWIPTAHCAPILLCISQEKIPKKHHIFFSTLLFWKAQHTFDSQFTSPSSPSLYT